MMRVAHGFLILFAVSAQTAWTQTSAAPQGRLDLVGEAPNACVVSSAESVAGSNATFQSLGTNAGQIRITEMVDPQTSEARASTINVALPIICNSAHRLIVRSGNGGLLRQGGSAQGQGNGFREFVPYHVSTLWSGQTLSASSDQAPASINVVDGAAGEASVTIDVPGGGTPLVAGAYSDFVVIELRVED